MACDLPPSQVPQLTLKRRRSSMDGRQGIVNNLKKQMTSPKGGDPQGGVDGPVVSNGGDGAAAGTQTGAEVGMNDDLAKMMGNSGGQTIAEQRRVAEAVFRRYDVDENGVLDEWECALMLIEVGSN